MASLMPHRIELAKWMICDELHWQAPIFSYPANSILPYDHCRVLLVERPTHFRIHPLGVGKIPHAALIRLFEDVSTLLDKRWRDSNLEADSTVLYAKLKICFVNVLRRLSEMQLNYAIVFVSDMKRSLTFYRDIIGLPLRFESPEWTEFATEGATLALHKAESFDQANSPINAAGTCRPGFRVPNIADFHQKMTAQNVRCIQEPKETFGVKIAQYIDPDGLVISVSEQR